MDVTVPQVVWSGGGVGVAGIDIRAIRAVPVLRNSIGPGAEVSWEAFRGYMPFLAAVVAHLTEPLAAYLAADLALPREFRAGDLVLLDANPELREAPTASSGWIVADSAGLRVRYVRRVRGGLEISWDPQSTGAGDWQVISLQGRNILEIVRARIVWIGREMETPFAGPHGTPRGGD
jgi:hypothetical protein